MKVRRSDIRALTGALVLAVVFGLLPVLSFALPALVRVPRVQDPRPGAPAARALFSHRSHEPLRCYQCHPGIFPSALKAFTHREMDQGRYCGACHEGRRATAINHFACERCHAP